jgi:maleamate amidohydrolase
VIVSGGTTSSCVRAAVVDVGSMNFRPVVVRDCIGGRGRDPHAANLFDMGQKYAELLTAGEVRAVLGAVADIASDCGR